MVLLCSMAPPREVHHMYSRAKVKDSRRVTGAELVDMMKRWQVRKDENIIIIHSILVRRDE